MTRREAETADRVASEVARRREQKLTEAQRGLIVDAMRVLYSWGAINWDIPNPQADEPWTVADILAREG